MTSTTMDTTAGRPPAPRPTPTGPDVELLSSGTNRLPPDLQRARLIVLLLATLMAALSVWAGIHIHRALTQVAQGRLQGFVRDHALAVEGRLASIEAELRGLRALFRASEEVTGEEFRAYVEASGLLAHYPEIGAVTLLRSGPDGGVEVDHAISRRTMAMEMDETPPPAAIHATTNRSRPVVGRIGADGRFWILCGMDDPRLEGLVLGLHCSVDVLFGRGDVPLGDTHDIQITDRTEAYRLAMATRDRPSGESGLVASDAIGLPDREWTIRFRTGTEWRSAHERALPPTVGAAGIILAVLTALLGWHLVGTRQQALALAAEMTVELRQREADSREALRRLRELEALRDGLTGMIIHDMRTPLMGVHGFIELARSRRGDTDPLLAKAQTQSLVLTTMIDNLLDLRQLEEQQMPVEPEAVRIRDLCQEAVSRLGALAAQREIDIAVPAELQVHADVHLVVRVLANLLGNAVTFSPAEDPITIAATTVADGVRIDVCDAGPGIPEAERERIFDSWIQGHGSRGGGSGLGLAFCRLAVEAHGGRIGVEPRQPSGSRFWFILPDEADVRA